MVAAKKLHQVSVMDKKAFEESVEVCFVGLRREPIKLLITEVQHRDFIMNRL
jgi:hypothetical protein